MPVTEGANLTGKLYLNLTIVFTHPVGITVTVQIHCGHRGIRFLLGVALIYSEAESHRKSQGEGLALACRLRHLHRCRKPFSVKVIVDGVNDYFIFTQSRCTHHCDFYIHTICGTDILPCCGTICHRKEFLLVDVECILINGLFVDFPILDVVVMVRGP